MQVKIVLYISAYISSHKNLEYRLKDSISHKEIEEWSFRHIVWSIWVLINDYTFHTHNYLYSKPSMRLFSASVKCIQRFFQFQKCAKQFSNKYLWWTKYHHSLCSLRDFYLKILYLLEAYFSIDLANLRFCVRPIDSNKFK